MVMLTFSILDPIYCFWANFRPKNQSCHFKLKFGTYTNLNMQNLIVRLISSILDRKYRFGANFGPKNQSCHFKLKFVTFTNLNMRN